MSIVGRSRRLFLHMYRRFMHRQYLEGEGRAVPFALKLIFAANVLARAYLLVESFIALPNSPPSVYQSPLWTAYVPHI